MQTRAYKFNYLYQLLKDINRKKKLFIETNNRQEDYFKTYS